MLRPSAERLDYDLEAAVDPKRLCISFASGAYTDATLGFLEICQSGEGIAIYLHMTAKRFFKAWSSNAMRSKLESVKKVVKMLRRHEEGLLSYSQHGISNACAEGFNSVIQLIKANAHGFRNFTNYRARILFHCGKLNLAMA